jgi:hypothetical protein
MPDSGSPPASDTNTDTADGDKEQEKDEVVKEVVASAEVIVAVPPPRSLSAAASGKAAGGVSVIEFEVEDVGVVSAIRIRAVMQVDDTTHSANSNGSVAKLSEAAAAVEAAGAATLPLAGLKLWDACASDGGAFLGAFWRGGAATPLVAGEAAQQLDALPAVAYQVCWWRGDVLLLTANSWFESSS